jgi:hypothetical protein
LLLAVQFFIMLRDRLLLLGASGSVTKQTKVFVGRRYYIWVDQLPAELQSRLPDSRKRTLALCFPA